MIRTINKAEQEGNNEPVRTFDTHTEENPLSIITSFPEGYTDAFGRQRVANQFTLADYSHIYGIQHPEMLIQKSGGISNVTFNGQKACASLFVGSDNNSYVIYQSRKYHYYRPGKSQLIYTSFNFIQDSQRLKRIGYFDDYNGIYFQQSGTQLQMVLRSNVNGSVQEQIVPQTGWNKDTCNGSGKSQFNINTNRTQLFTTDFQWLGVGRVRAGFVHDGKTVIAHEFYNSNNKDTVYWSNPSLPIRAEIRNIGSMIGPPGGMDFICASVMSEGGGNEVGSDFDVRTTGSRIVAANNSLPIMAIKMKTGHNGFINRGFNILGQVEVITEDKNIAWEIWRLPSGSSIIGGSWVSANNESATEYNITATGFNLAGGYRYDAGFALAGGLGAGQYQGKASVESPSESRQSYIAQNIEGTDSNVFALIVYNLTADPTDCFANIQWREIK